MSGQVWAGQLKASTYSSTLLANETFTTPNGYYQTMTIHDYNLGQEVQLKINGWHDAIVTKVSDCLDDSGNKLRVICVSPVDEHGTFHGWTLVTSANLSDVRSR